MGLYDEITLEKGLDVDFPALDGDLFDITWQTKSIARHHPLREMYRVTASGRLLKQDVEWNVVPEEERPGYDEALGGFEKDFEKAFGMLDRDSKEWEDTEYHGIFEFHSTIDGTYLSFEAKFTDGKLVDISRNELK